MADKHPSFENLKLYAAGEVDSQLAVLLSAHLAECPQCRRIFEEQQALIAEQWVNEPVAASEPSNVIEFDQFFDRLSQRREEKPVRKLTASCERTFSSEPDFPAKNVEWPRSLQPLVENGLEWRSAPGGLNFAKVNLEGPGQMYFLYLPHGSTIPEHTHVGEEISYVVAGSFSDSEGDYVTGDLVSFSAKHHHEPHTQDPDGCLLLTSVRGSLTFTKGWARILNWFN